MVPQSVSIVVEGLESAVSGAGLPGDAIGAQGLFIAMIISVLVSELFSALMKIDKIKIKMPASVPAAISQSFNLLIFNGAASDPSKVFKGKKMAGQMGNKKITVQNLEVVRVDAENNLLLVKGSVPGPKKCLVTIKETVKGN